MVNLAIDVSRDIHFYGKWSTGYRSGGANSRSTSYAQFNPETVSMFEVGAKTEFLDHRVRFNVAAYTGTYKNIQLDFSGQYTFLDANGNLVTTTRTTTDTVNAPGTGRLKGIELELAVAPVAGLTLTGSYSYNSVKIPDTVNPFPQNVGGTVAKILVPVPIYQPYTPTNSASASIDYETPFMDWKFKAHIDANYDSGYYAGYVDSNFEPLTRAVRYAQPKGDAGLVFNARIALADIPVGSTGAKLTLSAWARNLFDEQHIFLKFGAAGNGIQGFFNDPRTFGFDINFKM
jgi:iron complex outermembrane recepter protein